MNQINTAPATPQVGRAAAEFQRAAAELVAALLPTLPDKKRAGIDTCIGAGASLRAVAAVDGVGAARVVLEMLSVDGERTEEMASVFIDELPRRAA